MGGGPVEGLKGSCCVPDVVVLNDPAALYLGAGAHIPHLAVHRELLVELQRGHPRVHIINRDRTCSRVSICLGPGKAEGMYGGRQLPLNCILQQDSTLCRAVWEQGIGCNRDCSA